MDVLLTVVFLAVSLVPGFGEDAVSSAKLPTSQSPGEVSHLPSDQFTARVPFVVVDRHDRPVTDLVQDQVTVLDNGRSPQSILSFARAQAMPLRLGVLIDTSGSERAESRSKAFRSMLNALNSFLQEVTNGDGDQVFVMGFAKTASATKFMNHEEVSHSVLNLEFGGGTALYDAVRSACRERFMDNPLPQRRALVIISDGEDDFSDTTLREAIGSAQEAGVVVFTISTNTSGLNQKGDRNLAELSDATGGRIFLHQKPDRVAESFASIRHELDNQYAIAYVPSDSKKFHSVKIDVRANEKLRLRAPKGYYLTSHPLRNTP